MNITHQDAIDLHARLAALAMRMEFNDWRAFSDIFETIFREQAGLMTPDQKRAILAIARQYATTPGA